LSDHKPSSEAASPGIDGRRRVALAVVLSGIFVTIMDNSIVNVAIPVIRSTLHASFGEAELTVASYALAFSAGMITGGRLGDIYGQRRVFMVAFAAFTLTSFICGVAPNIKVFIAGRLLQGASAATQAWRPSSLPHDSQKRLGTIISETEKDHRIPTEAGS